MSGDDNTTGSDEVGDLEHQLEAILREAESTAAELRRELADQRERRRQHEEIERLEEHLANSRVRWEEVRDFFQEVLHEVRGEEAAWKARREESDGRGDGSAEREGRDGSTDGGPER